MEITPDWLTEVLRQADVLPRGKVRHIKIKNSDTFNSESSYLKVTYSGKAPETVPQRLFLKINHDGAGEREVRFYKHIEELSAPLPMVVRSYAADYNAEGVSYCLLEDISKTHALPVSQKALIAGRGVPCEEHLLAIVDALANFHAYWWNHPLIGRDAGTVRTWYNNAEAHQKYIERRQTECEKFMQTEGGSIPAEYRTLYEKALKNLPILWEKYLEPRIYSLHHLTLTHGDCYLTQFLVPLTEGQTYLIDFQDVSGNFGAYDLVYLFPTFWSPKQRYKNQREQRLLRRYYEVLVGHGIADYPLNIFLQDYRLMVSYMIFDPMFNAVSGASRAYWWRKMKCLVGAYLDLECAELAF